MLKGPKWAHSTSNRHSILAFENRKNFATEFNDASSRYADSQGQMMPDGLGILMGVGSLAGSPKMSDSRYQTSK